MTPFVRADVLSNYGQSIDNAAVICPGEANCQKFQGAAGNTHLQKERNACKPCELFPTKTEKYAKWQESLNRLVRAAKDIRRCRDSGYSMQTREFGDLEFETLLMIDEMIENQELLLKKQMNDALMAGFGLTRS